MNFMQLKMESKQFPIVRTVVLPEECTLAFLHRVIQDAFGWLDYHLYEFTDAKGRRYFDPTDEGSELDDAKPVDATTVALAKVFKKRGDTLDYEYDFGDGNEVGITFVARPKSNRGGFEACFESKGPNMIEDSMGLGGTGGVCEILRAGRKNKNYRQAVDWLYAAFRLTRTETDELLLAAGFALSPVIAEDAVFAFRIQSEVFDLFEVNRILYEQGLKIIPPK